MTPSRSSPCHHDAWSVVRIDGPGTLVYRARGMTVATLPEHIPREDDRDREIELPERQARAAQTRTLASALRWCQSRDRATSEGDRHARLPHRTAPACGQRVPHRRRHRDDADLPRRVRPARVRGLRPAGGRDRPGSAAVVLPHARCHRPRRRLRLHPGGTDLAGQPGLGREARLLPRDAGRGEPGRHRSDGAAPPRVRVCRDTGGHQWLHRTAQRRLPTVAS